MSKLIVRSLLFALAGVFAINIRAEVAWTTGSCAPSAWTALANNLLAGETGAISGDTATGYSTRDPELLTDGEVQPEGQASEVHAKEVGFRAGASVVWTFAAPKTIESVRVSCGYPVAYQNYSGLRVSSVEVQVFGESTWTALNTTAGEYSDNGQNAIQWLVLADGNGGPLAEAVVALKVTFGSPTSGLASYCGEIEAVGSAAALGPVVGAHNITPAKTKARVTGSIADPGTDATACDVYLSLDGGAATKIAEGVTGSFEYQLQGLTAGTTYAYELSVSNNAPTAKGTVRSGSFTTMVADAATAVWAKELYLTDDWRALDCNVLSGVRGTMGAGQSPNGYGTNDLIVLSDGYVPSVAGKNWIVGISPNQEINWNLAVPVTLEQLRISSSYLEDPHFSGVNIASVKVKCVDSDEWVEVPGSSSGKIAGDGTTQNIICATLSDVENGYIAQNVIALKVVFGAAVYVNANYYAEIEAVGYAEATGPVIGAFDIAPAKTKAMVSGSIADPGTDATACDVYFALDGGAATKTAEGVTDSFEYQLQGLTAGTTYAYELSVSNNALTAKGTVRSGSFTTLAADAQTASWTQGEYAPAEWTALANNILRGLDATEKSGVSFAASQDMTKLTNGGVPNPAAGGETVGFGNAGTIAWAFAKPMTIEKIRLSSLWESTLYNGISVNAIHVKRRGSTEWVALDVPTVQWTGGTQLGQTETLSDAENGFLAQNVVGLKITFGAQKAAVANYYAEIEVVGYKKQTGLVLHFH